MFRFGTHRYSLTGRSTDAKEIFEHSSPNQLLPARHHARYSRSCDCVSQAHKFVFMQQNFSPFVVVSRAEMKMSRTKRKRQSDEASYQLRIKIETLKIRFECREEISKYNSPFANEEIP